MSKEYDMTARRRFTADFKARVALDGLSGVFANGSDTAATDHEFEAHDLYAKIGQLTVAGIFSQRVGARRSEDRKTMIERTNPKLSIPR